MIFWAGRIPKYLAKSGARCSSTLDIHAFSQSLLLPKTSFPLRSNPAEVEQRLRERTCTQLYQWQSTNTRRPEFVLHDGPPYANGDLHMGHAMNKILKDIINRFHLSRGRRVHYVPGWDCHGLPIENKALNELGADSTSLSPLAIRRAAHKTALREINTQKEQFQRLGIMADWSTEHTYRTIDHSYQMRQLRIFRDMVQNGLIYRRYRPVHFSPSSRSALAEAELVYKDDHVSHSVYVSFALADLRDNLPTPLRDLAVASTRPVHLLVWTTTPWTLTANMAIAVGSDLKYVALQRTDDGTDVLPLLIIAKDRAEALSSIIGSTEVVAEFGGSELLNLSYTPIFAPLCPGLAPLRIMHSGHVSADSGTGLVHCAPAHGAEDYNVFLERNLLDKMELVCHVGNAGEFTSAVTDTVGERGKALIGESVLDSGSRKVVELLKEVGALVKIQRIKHRYPYDWRTNKPVITTATSQWFANLDDIKDHALAAIKNVSFVPAISRSRLTAFIELRSEWCISRQRAWGVPIPALHHIPTDKAVLDPATLDHILAVLDDKGIEHWWEGPVADFVPPALRDAGAAAGAVWRKGTDTMDVWFDSGTSWAMLTARDGGAPRADVCVEGSDQHRGWFQSQLLTAVASAPPSPRPIPSPYGALITHGMVLDQTGKKMSKSLGNVTSPMTVVNGGVDPKKEPAYGADVLRFWIGTVDYWNDSYLGPVVLAQAAEGVRKLRNTARFILGNIGNIETRAKMQRVPRSEMGLAERYIMHELYVLEQTALEGYAQYNFAKVVAALNNFANITLSSLYFDISKDSLYANALDGVDRRAVVTVLEQVLKTMNSIMAPIVPYLAEEIHEAFNETQSSVFMTEWKSLEPEWHNPQSSEEMKMLLRLRTAVLAGLEEARADKKIKSSLEAEVELLVPDLEQPSAFIDLLQREESFLKTFFITSDASIIDEGSLGTTSPPWVFLATTPIPSSNDDLTIRIRPAQLEKCSRCWTFTRPPAEPLCPRCASVVDPELRS